MEYFEKFKNFLFGNSHSSKQAEIPSQRNRLPEYYNDQSKERENFFSNEPPTFTPRHFEMFSDPIKMHEYFEQQMNEMLKNFGFHEFGQNLFGGFNENSDFDKMLEDAPQSSGNLRDQFLKKGYEKPSPPRLDKNLDDQLNVGDFDSIFGRKDNHNTLVPYQESQQPSTQNKTLFFGQSVSKKIVRNPDGSVEKHSTVRDNDGNEETTITRQLGDKEVTIIKKRDKFGKEEIIENLINVDENEKNSFLAPPLPSQPHSDNSDNNPFNNFPFKKFFK